MLSFEGGTSVTKPPAPVLVYNLIVHYIEGHVEKFHCANRWFVGKGFLSIIYENGTNLRIHINLSLVSKYSVIATEMDKVQPSKVIPIREDLV